jgi:hypothetical protein
MSGLLLAAHDGDLTEVERMLTVGQASISEMSTSGATVRSMLGIGLSLRLEGTDDAELMVLLGGALRPFLSASELSSHIELIARG